MRLWQEPEEILVPEELYASVGGHPLVARTLARRGLVDPSAVRGFLDPEAYQPAPPWEIFFDVGEPQDARTPEAVIQEVRQAVVGTLAAHGRRLSGLRPEELVVVAVDFLPSLRAGLRAVPERTLVIRVPKKDLDDLGASRLSSQDFAKRVQASEY